MILYPAIDLKDGACVRVVRGELATATVYNRDPAAQARAWAADGFSWLHVVDLDGSVAGRSVNQEAVAAILGAASIPVQLGGGIRSFSDIEHWLEAGVARVILGTAAVRDPEMVAAAATAFPGRIAASIDARAGKIAIEGWTKATQLAPIELARRCEDAGVAALVVTDIDRDGALAGIDAAVFGSVADQVGIPVIAAGGIASLDDIRALAAWRGKSIGGAVLGRALYVGQIAPAEALAAAA